MRRKLALFVGGGARGSDDGSAGNFGAIGLWDQFRSPGDIHRL
jgi:hypothetical protein